MPREYVHSSVAKAAVWSFPATLPQGNFIFPGRTWAGGKLGLGRLRMGASAYGFLIIRIQSLSQQRGWGAGHGAVPHWGHIQSTNTWGVGTAGVLVANPAQTWLAIRRKPWDTCMGQVHVETIKGGTGLSVLDTALSLE